MHNEVQQTVLKLASKQGVKVHQTKMKVDDPVNVLKDLGETPKQSEIACLAAIVSRLETDLGPMQARRASMGVGDVDTLRSLPHSVDDRIACLAAVSNSTRIRNLVIRAQEDWMIEAEDASRATNRRSRCSRWTVFWVTTASSRRYAQRATRSRAHSRIRPYQAVAAAAANRSPNRL